MTTQMTGLTAHEQQQIERANDSGLQPIVFVHGLWLLASSWDHWRTLFEEKGYTTIAPGWPDDPETGGLIAQKIAGEGVAVVTVAIDPAPFRGVLPLPLSALKSSSAVLGNPLNYTRAVPLTYEQFRFAFANVVDESEAHQLYETYSVPGSGVPLFQAATANLNPWTEAQVNTTNPERGPLLIISGEHDNTVPWAIAHASYKQQEKNPGVTEIKEIPDRGHSLTIDHGWQEVAETALAFIGNHLPNH